MAFYAFWSDTAAERIGIVIYTTPEGKEVEACFIDRSPEARGYGYKDIKPLGAPRGASDG